MHIAIAIKIQRQEMKVNTWYCKCMHSAHTDYKLEPIRWLFIPYSSSSSSYFNSSHRGDWGYLHNSAIATRYIASCTTRDRNLASSLVSVKHIFLLLFSCKCQTYIFTSLQLLQAKFCQWNFKDENFKDNKLTMKTTKIVSLKTYVWIWYMAGGRSS